MEDGIAKSLGLKLGDSLRFDVGGMQSDAKITSFRKVDWGSMRANFFVIYPLANLADVPATYMTAFRAPERKGFDNELVRAFPNITNVDMTATISQVQGVLDKVIRAVEFLFAFTLAAGVVVLFAAITATREERAREFAIMRAVGARALLLRQVQRAELAGVGLLAGFLASVVASAVGWGLARFVFDFGNDRVHPCPHPGCAGRRCAGAGGGVVGIARGTQPARRGGRCAARLNNHHHANPGKTTFLDALRLDRRRGKNQGDGRTLLRSRGTWSRPMPTCAAPMAASWPRRASTCSGSCAAG